MTIAHPVDLVTFKRKDDLGISADFANEPLRPAEITVSDVLVSERGCFLQNRRQLAQVSLGKVLRTGQVTKVLVYAL
jgi:hypothetical protein